MKQSFTKRIIPGLFLVCLTAISTNLISYSSGPPAEYSNAPGESNCTSCHGSFALATSGSTWDNIDLATSAPDLSSFQPNQTYSMTLSFADPTSTRYGFELCVLPAGAADTDPSVGTLSSINGSTQIVTGSVREYIEHTSAGNAAPASTRSWDFEWTAPLTYTGEVDFYVVINSTNSDGSSSGDQIYAKVFSGSVLPVKWLDISATLLNNKPRLSWSTSSEINNDFFEIERSNNAKSWKAIGKVKGSGNSAVMRKYFFDDEYTPSILQYYRIRQVDYDGKSDYSKVVTAGSAKAAGISFSPVPVSDVLTVHALNGNTYARIALYDLNGRVMIEKNLSDSPTNAELDVSGLNKGIYILGAEGKNSFELYKLVITH